MVVIDYARSFVTFVLPENQARLQLEGSCQLTAPGTAPERYLMFASCRGEWTYGEPGRLFLQPNYDFSGLFSDTRYRLHRVRYTTEGEALDAGLIAERFSGMRPYHLRTVEATPLADAQAVIEATLANRVIIARTEIADTASGVTQVIEYPVKTMNVKPETMAFQVDTGPLPLYDASSDCPEVMGSFLWAFCAFNDFTGADFVCQAPVPIEVGGQVVAATTQYSEVRCFAEARNALFALEA
ncbi:MAG: hypothetical protein HPY69_17275 [Armatimonadetes bacterium]|nr:hypothetical protein [Armatimonadota bacterium]